MAAHEPRGFTLVEVLVALSLLALVGLIAWRGLDHVAEQRSRADADTLATDRVLRTLAQMERDFGERIPDALFVGNSGVGGVLPRALKAETDGEGNIRLRVLRRHAGVHGARSVTYAVEDSWLMRHLSAEGSAGPTDTVSMLEASRLEVRFLVNGQWTDARRLRADDARAAAIELTIERENGERYIQVLQL